MRRTHLLARGSARLGDVVWVLRPKRSGMLWDSWQADGGTPWNSIPGGGITPKDGGSGLRLPSRLPHFSFARVGKTARRSFRGYSSESGS